MKNFGILCITILAIVSCKKENTKSEDEATNNTSAQKTEEVATFTGQQVTGVTVTDQGRVFVNFPRWREGVEASVKEVKNGQSVAFPNKKWNEWEIGQSVNDSVFVAVQSVVAFKNELYVLDTRCPLFKGVIGAPKLFVFDLKTNALKRIYTFPKESFHIDSYINDLRIDEANGSIYLTDSGHAGLIVLTIDTGKAKRVLDNHFSTKAEVDHLTINGKEWKNTIHSDGIALNPINHKLYFHALTGYTLYAIEVQTLLKGTTADIAEAVEKVAKTAAPDGMIFDAAGNLYYADLEQNAIMKMDTTGSLSIMLKGDKVRWADTFSIYDNQLYYTNSRINEVNGSINKMNFTLNRIKL
ncbi:MULTISPECIES: L-dopachrome tautomerase-related protein [unclassified Flavobacterium]|uniref:L-dopachrome tautomerase-related protein n=1 Tax=unclassified Flavobacterium TaxID=196869 RepID=UPI003F927CCA